MPFTFFAHQAPVAPLKLRWPRAFDGTALVVGSMAPDFEYFLRGAAFSSVSHTLQGQFVFCLPMTLGVVWLTRHLLAPVLSAHLPDAGDFHLRDLAMLGTVRPALVITVISALLGSFSHIAWDAFTHPTGAGVLHVLWLQRSLVTYDGRSLPIYKALQHGSTLVGAAMTLHFARIAGRLHWRLDPALTPPEAFVATSASRIRLWSCVAASALLRASWAVATRPTHVRLLSLGMGVRVFLSLVAGAFVGALLGCAWLRAKPE